MSFEELLRLADSGDVEAMYRVGIEYSDGTETAQDYAEAARYRTDTASQSAVSGSGRVQKGSARGSSDRRMHAPCVPTITKKTNFGYVIMLFGVSRTRRL